METLDQKSWNCSKNYLRGEIRKNKICKKTFEENKSKNKTQKTGFTF